MTSTAMDSEVAFTLVLNTPAPWACAIRGKVAAPASLRSWMAQRQGASQMRKFAVRSNPSASASPNCSKPIDDGKDTGDSFRQANNPRVTGPRRFVVAQRGADGCQALAPCLAGGQLRRQALRVAPESLGCQEIRRYRRINLQFDPVGDRYRGCRQVQF